MNETTLKFHSISNHKILNKINDNHDDNKINDNHPQITSNYRGQYEQHSIMDGMNTSFQYDNNNNLYDANSQYIVTMIV